MPSLKKLFCSHRYRSLGFKVLDRQKGRESYHRIQCVICGDTRLVDSHAWHFKKYKRAC